MPTVARSELTAVVPPQVKLDCVAYCMTDFGSQLQIAKSEVVLCEHKCSTCHGVRVTPSSEVMFQPDKVQQQQPSSCR